VGYAPRGNLAALFETNEHSWHGFRTIALPEDKDHPSHKSLTVYYYGKERPAEERRAFQAPPWAPVPWDRSGSGGSWGCRFRSYSGRSVFQYTRTFRRKAKNESLAGESSLTIE